jgi:hypothetical protein
MIVITNPSQTHYDHQDFNKIVGTVYEAKGSLGQIADLNYIARVTFFGWIKHGDEDRKDGLTTELAMLSAEIRKRQAEVVIDLCNQGLKDFKRAKFIMWWLGRVFREDFGVESEEMKLLKDLVFNQILPKIVAQGERKNVKAA